MHGTITAEALGSLDRAGFVDAVGFVAEHSPWVAESAYERRPFADREAVAGAFRSAIEDAPAERQLALIRAHPDLAGKLALAGDLTAASASEQASAGLDRLTADELERFTRLNNDYRERFGFPFVICVREHTKESIAAAFAERLANDAQVERATAIDQIARIMRLRLLDALCST